MKYWLYVGLILLPFVSTAQTGGENTYDFLTLVSSARVAGLGGNLNCVKDDDLNQFAENPALLNEQMHDQMVLNYVNYFAGINYGYAAYSRSYNSIGSFAAGLQYLNYGKFTEADATGQILGNFNAAEYALNLGYSRTIDTVFSIGATFKTIYSQLNDYNSLGFALDIGGIYYNEKTDFTAAVVVRNAGFQVKRYVKGNGEPLPFDVQIGISKRLAHMPFRFSIIAHNLHKPDLSYRDPALTQTQIDPLTGEEVEPKKRIGDKIMRHFIFGGEFVPSKNFNIRIGYNYLRRQELKVETKTGLAGFSFGVGIKISKFKFNYGLAKYHLAGSTHHISISTNLSDFHSKQVTTPGNE